MNKSAPFQLRWRGQVTGPLALAEILRQLDEREIGLWHEIGQGGQWTTLGEYLEAENRDALDADAAKPIAKTRQLLPGPQTATGARPAPAAGESSSTRGLAAGTGGLLAAPTPPGRNLKLFIFLGALLGFTGAHNFYAGYWGTAVVQVLLSAVTILLGFGFFVSWLWALIELLVVHTDARGRRMS